MTGDVSMSLTKGQADDPIFYPGVVGEWLEVVPDE